MGTAVNSMEKYAPYDKILVDAPCNVDRDLLRGRDEKMARWSVGIVARISTVKVSAERQLKLLRNALWLLKEGGVLLFCNRALAGGECDEVVEQLLVQERDRFELRVLPVEEEICRMVPNYGGESTGHGMRILPDVGFFGPIYQQCFARALPEQRSGCAHR
ncbi:unnamed protein product [Prorocentrum cordatum]|uniref:SAM-dependent MTase RsmB/NOP-type domain-containing protein n=1 Tax=Prorocentrum cordatum TaxID=2364126 RepID=A0ABN9VEZ7_9DINO|nr:unnamed protein product [Polarella glacialis]